jgi:hypothetical protein
LKGQPEGRNEVVLEPAMLIGLGVVAVWMYLKWPRLRPRSLILAIVHVVVSFTGFALLPGLLSVVLPVLPAPAWQPYVVLLLLIPALTYLLLSWIWLIGRMLHELFRGPRGGHPVSGDS